MFRYVLTFKRLQYDILSHSALIFHWTANYLQWWPFLLKQYDQSYESWKRTFKLSSKLNFRSMVTLLLLPLLVLLFSREADCCNSSPKPGFCSQRDHCWNIDDGSEVLLRPNMKSGIGWSGQNGQKSSSTFKKCYTMFYCMHWVKRLGPWVTGELDSVALFDPRRF